MIIKPTGADEPMMPKSLDQAIAMERANALPLTAFYDTPALTSSSSGANRFTMGGSKPPPCPLG
jgi:hypothetical protein